MGLVYTIITVQLYVLGLKNLGLYILLFLCNSYVKHLVNNVSHNY